MRFVIVLCALASSAIASEGIFHSEMLVGWSADGSTWAVIEFQPPEYRLVVYERGKQVAALKATDKGVPASDDLAHSGFEKIDVATWKPLAKYKLVGSFGAARKRFDTAYDLKAAGSLLPNEKQRCKGGGWSLVRKKDKQVVHKVDPANDHCFGVVGGYLDATSAHALVKLHEEWAWTDQGEYMFEGADRYELVDVSQ